MQAPRLNEVLARVVAWHNRHPLARRIQPSQVHGIGEVVLPFASATPLAPPVAAAAPAHLPTIEELLAAEAIPPEVARFDALVRRATQRPAAEAATAPAPLAPDDAGDTDDGEAALEIPLLDHGDAPDEAGDAAAAADAEAADADVALADPPTRSDAPRAAPDAPRTLTLTEAATATHVDLGEPLAPPAPATAAAAPPLPWWQRLLARLPGRGSAPRRPRLQPLFSEDFLWPLSPARIARWARRHGALQAQAPADWPHRVITTDPRLRAVQRLRGQVHETPLHVLSAAIGVGDRRMRVLLAPDGAVLGPRAYSPPRLALAAGVAAVALLAGGWWLRQLAAGPAAAAAPAVAPDASAALAAPAASTAASATSSAAAASAPAAPPVAADAAASQAATTAPDRAAASAGQGAGPAAAAAPHAATATAAPAASAPAAAAAAAGQPASAAAAADSASAAQASIRPQLSDEARYAARVQAAALRGEAPPPPPAPPTVYAVVTGPERQREAALRAQSLMQAATAKLSGPVPEHAELMGQAGQWRAAWWPFASLVDAERARVLLAGRGLKAEVVEF